MKAQAVTSLRHALWLAHMLASNLMTLERDFYVEDKSKLVTEQIIPTLTNLMIYADSIIDREDNP
jgi:hypothetical protein